VGQRGDTNESEDTRLTYHRLLLALSLLSASLASPSAFAQQSATFTLLESAGNVVGTWSGAFDLTGLSWTAGASKTGWLYKVPDMGFGAGSGNFVSYGVTMVQNLALSTGTESTLFTTSFAVLNSASSTGAFSVVQIGNSDGIGVDLGYTTGAALNGASTWNSKTFATLFLNPGTYVWNYGPNNSTFTVQIGPVGGTSGGGTTGGGGAVPEPGEWAAMGILGAGLTGLVIRKRRRA